MSTPHQQSYEPTPEDRAALEARAQANQSLGSDARQWLESKTQEHEEEARRQEAMREQSRRRAEERTAHLLALAEKARAEGRTSDSRSEDWTDTDEVARRKNVDLFKADVVENHVRELASYKPSDIEDPKLREAVEWFAGNAIHNGPKQNFLLYGPVGTGKTVSALTCGYLVVKNSALSVRFVSHGYYLAALRPNGPIPPGLTVNTFRNRYLSADVLVLDDLGAARAMGVAAREWVVEQTFDLIDRRVNDGKRTIITTNIPNHEELASVFGDPVRSRIGMDLFAVLVDGPDRRQPTAWGYTPE